MKIAYDHQAFCMQTHGGVSRYFAEVVTELQALGSLDARVIAPLHLNEHLRGAQVSKAVAGCYLPAVRGRVRLMQSLNPLLLSLAWAGRRFDIIHETFYSTIRRGVSRVRIVTVYDMIHELFAEEFPDAAAISTAKRAAVTRADHVICISETTRQDVMRLFDVSASKCTVVYLGSSLSQGGGAARDVQVESGKPYVLYVGHRRGYKNFQQLLNAFTISQRLRCEFDLIAFGGGAFTDDEHKAIQTAALGSTVKHLRGDDVLLAATYRRASAFVYPSRYEGFGIPPLEAMAYECPVVCSAAGSIKEIVGQAGAYFDPEDAQELATQLERVLSDTDYAAHLRHLGRQRVGQFSWRKCATDTLDVYRKLVPP